jgi:formylglycine-generating enzyme required for sulfatase activity
VYPWGDAWDAAQCNTWEKGPHETTPVGLYPDGISPNGLLDVAGNVWEWTGSKKRAYPYKTDDGRNEPGGDDNRVVRGGAWYFNQDYARCAYRVVYRPVNRYNIIGFRVVVSPGSRG